METLEKEYLKLYRFGLVALFVLVCGPLLWGGVLNADEFLFYSRGLTGDVLQLRMSEIQSCGRNLQVLEAFGNAFPYFFKSMIAARLVGIALLAVTLLMMGILLQHLIDDRKFILFYLICVIFLMPIGFEGTVPTAYNAMILLPFLLLLGSVLLYIDYLDRGNWLPLLFSLILFALSLSGKEFFVTYVLVFPVLYLFRKENGDIHMLFNRHNSRKIGAALAHIPVALIYCVLVVYFSKHAPQAYAGNQIGISSIKNTLLVLMCFFSTALPGRMLFVSKYTYLFDVNNRIMEIGYWSQALSALKESEPVAFLVRVCTGFRQMAQFLFHYDESFRILLIFGVFLYLTTFLTRNSSESKKISPALILTALVYSVLPALPNAVSAGYQNGIVYDDFSGQPVTILLYFAFVLFAAALLWNLFSSFKRLRRFFVITILAVIGVYGIFQQTYNSVFMDRQEENYQYLSFTEDVIQTDAFRFLQGGTVYSPDLFQVRDAIGFSDNAYYWILADKGVDVTLTPDQTQPHQAYLSSPQDEVIFLCCTTGGVHTDYLFTRKALTSPYLVQDETGETVIFDSKQQQYDPLNSMHIYQRTNSG